MSNQRALIRKLDQAAKKADRIMGQKATLTRRDAVTVDVTTGQQTATDMKSNVIVRPWPLSVREAAEFSNAGLGQIDTRWTMRTHYADDIDAGDILTVGGFDYEVTPNGAARDEFGVEWTIHTRRRR